MLNNITNELIQKYKTYYRGGGYYYADPKRTTPKDNGGVRWDTKLAYGSLDKDLEKYLLGTIDKGIVLSPIIKPYNKCFWGAIDVDGNVYKDDTAKLNILKKIKDLPLIPCLSKSNGLHLYLFLKEAATAKDLITVLNNLCYQNKEIVKETRDKILALKMLKNNNLLTSM